MSEALIEHLRDLFEPLGPISARAMFGGHGVYFDGQIIGIIIDEALYLKTDEQTRERFEARGLPTLRLRPEGQAADHELLVAAGRGDGFTAGDAAVGAAGDRGGAAEGRIEAARNRRR